MERDAKIPGSVLYVEDDEATRDAVGASLARRVETLFFAENGRVGLQMFGQHAPDVVITDITMPGLDGLAMAREIKGADAQIPIIVTSAYSDTHYLIEAIDIGIDGYVLKPVDFGRLFAVVRRSLAFVDHKRQAERHQEEQRRLLGELQRAATRIKTLSGLLPICANCKRIRDDRGYWKQLEQFISDHADVVFTHSLCPQCVDSLYPDLGPDPGSEG